MPLLSLLRNRLVYPGGLPGVNLSHPASKNLVMSAISGSYAPGSSASFIALNGNRFVNFSGLLINAIAVIDPIVGPATYNNVASNHQQGVAGPSNTPPAVTTAVIITLKSIAASNSYQNMTTYASSASGLWLKSNGTLAVPALFTGSDNLAAFGLSAGHSYFLAASCSGPNVVGSTVNYVARDLGTGQIFSSTTTNGVSSSQGDGGVWVGEDNAEPSLSAIAATMYSRTFLTMPQLLQWEDDPWSFWYPQPLDLVDLLSTPAQIAAVGPTGPGALQPWNLPGLGPASRHVSLLNAALPSQVVAAPPSGGTLPFMGVG